MPPLSGRLAQALAERYSIERQLGEGGMATVFLARDIRHDRRVAIKVLREDVAQRMGAERFLREIRTTATLNHPHIVPLHDSGEADGIVYYVMPFVEGESLRDRLDREGQLPVPEAVRIACDIASALDYAHRHGFVHRDVKPANILLHENRALVADFGIARVLEGSGGDLRLTESGMSIGTLQYMSPEQAMGEKHVTGRTDVFALGAMLYEMLAGEPPFTGESTQTIVAKMMTTSPVPIRELRPTVPARVAAAIDGALQKVAADRFGTAAEFAEALESRDVEVTAEVGARVPRRVAWLVAAGALVIAIAAVGGALVARAFTPMRASTATVVRAVIPLARDQLMVIQGYPLDISRDGKYLVYVGDDSGKSQLFLRPLADTITRPIPGTAGANTPFMSPDGEWIGFFADDKLKKVPRGGGAPIDVASTPSTETGATWGIDGTLLYALGDSALYRVRSDGSAPDTIVAEPKSPTRRRALGALKWPSLLPGNARAIVSTDSGIGIVDLASGDVRIVIHGRQARYLPTAQLLFDDNEGRIRVVGFDLRRGVVKGASVPVFEAFRGPGGLSASYFTVSDNGTLVYMPGGFQRLLVRVDRYGRETPINAEPRGYRFPQVSPDGKSIVVTVDPRPSSIWLVDATTGQASPLTTDGVHSIAPVWSPDGTRIAFNHYLGPAAPIAWMAAQPGAEMHSAFAAVLDERLGDIGVTQWTKEAGLFAYQVNSKAGQSRADIVRFQLGDRHVTPVVASPADDRMPALSPDGRWLAYASTISGTNEVYVRPYPQGGPGILVSAHGGTEPRWSRDGAQLFYRSGSRIMSVAHDRRSTAGAFGTPQVLFSGTFDFSQERNWSPSPDGSFIMIKADPTMGRQLRVVLNWFDDLTGASKAK
jgi:serine/threonine-protein kinase